MTVNSFDHLHIYSEDPAASIQFYLALGADRIGALPGSAEIRHLLILGGQYLVISAFPDGMGPGPVPEIKDGAFSNGFGVAHIGLNVNSVPKAMSELEALGIMAHSAVRVSGPTRFVYFTAPDGVVIELTEYIVPKSLLLGLFLSRVLNGLIHEVQKLLAKILVAALGRQSGRESVDR